MLREKVDEGFAEVRDFREQVKQRFDQNQQEH